MQPSEPGQPIQSSVIQPTSTDLPPVMETSTMTSAEGSTTSTISNTPTIANNLEPGRYVVMYCISIVCTYVHTYIYIESLILCRHIYIYNFIVKK